jgi:Rrf2 family protein
MLVTKETDYAVRALLDLAEHSGRGPVQARDVSTRQAIPDSFLKKILRTLRMAGMVHPSRGPKGGHTLAMPPGEIRLSDVLDAVEGPSANLGCIEVQGQYQIADLCLLQEAWRDAGQAAYQVLASITIADLLQRQRQRINHQMYYI